MKPASVQPPVPARDQQPRLKKLNELNGFKLLTRDDNIGILFDFLFDNEAWGVRYVVVDIGQWLPGRKVLLTPGVLQKSRKDKESFTDPAFTTSLTREALQNSPDIDTAIPLSRQHEMELHRYHGWPFYWAAAGAGVGMIAPPFPGPPPESAPPQREEFHLRSFLEIKDYEVDALNGDIGKVEDILVDNQSWVIRYLVVNTHQWLPERRILLSPRWLQKPDGWQHRKLKFSLTQERVKSSPEFDPANPVTRDYEVSLHAHYTQPGYW